MRLVALGVDDEAFELLRKLIGIAHRPTRSIGEGFEPMLPVAVENLVAGPSFGRKRSCASGAMADADAMVSLHAHPETRASKLSCRDR